MIFQGQWSTPRTNHRLQGGREPPEKQTNSPPEDSDLLRLLSNQLLPVRRHLQRQLEKEREQAAAASIELSVTKESDLDPPFSLQCERKFHEEVSVSVDGTKKSVGQRLPIILISGTSYIGGPDDFHF